MTDIIYIKDFMNLEEIDKILYYRIHDFIFEYIEELIGDYDCNEDIDNFINENKQNIYDIIYNSKLSDIINYDYYYNYKKLNNYTKNELYKMILSNCEKDFEQIKLNSYNIDNLNNICNYIDEKEYLKNNIIFQNLILNKIKSSLTYILFLNHLYSYIIHFINKNINYKKDKKLYSLDKSDISSNIYDIIINNEFINNEINNFLNVYKNNLTLNDLKNEDFILIDKDINLQNLILYFINKYINDNDLN